MKKRIIFVGLFLILFTTFDLASSDGIVKYDITVVNATLSYNKWKNNKVS